MRDEGFLLLDTLLALLTFSVIVTVLIPALVTLQQLDKQSTEHLRFSREIYLHLLNNDSIIIDDEFFNTGAICSDYDKRICVQ